MDHLATALCKYGYCVSYIRPYVFKSRLWELALSKVPIVGSHFRKFFIRRQLPAGLKANSITEKGIILDFLLALSNRLNYKFISRSRIRELLVDLRTKAVSSGGEKDISGFSLVIASWSCAKPAFQSAKNRKIFCILNYSIAHHYYTKRFLNLESKLQPEFSNSLNSHNYSKQFEKQLDSEIYLADLILVGSAFVKKTFIEEGVSKNKIKVLPYGVNVELFKPLPSIKNETIFNILFVGQIGQRKGISYLLEAYNKFKCKDTKLTLVGNFQGPKEIFSSYSHLFNHIPHVSHSDLKSLYQQADIFVFPTLIEGMPIVVLEAMASGLPVITTANGSDDIVRDGIDGFIVPVRDVQAILDKMKILKKNKKMRFEMAENARNRAVEFSWDCYESKAVELVNDIIKDSKNH